VALQPEPLPDFGKQLPLEHQWLELHWLSVVQVPGQLGFTPSQTNGAHAGEPALPCATMVQLPGLALHTSQPPPQAVLQQ
jgi:hypothetical protein